MGLVLSSILVDLLALFLKPFHDLTPCVTDGLSYLSGPIIGEHNPHLLVYSHNVHLYISVQTAARAHWPRAGITLSLCLQPGLTAWPRVHSNITLGTVHWARARIPIWLRSASRCCVRSCQLSSEGSCRGLRVVLVCTMLGVSHYPPFSLSPLALEASGVFYPCTLSHCTVFQ